MTDTPNIPRAVVRRISFYLRQLERLQQEGVETTSSAQHGEAIGASSAQVRKDLACFGQFGRRGVGYDVRSLVTALRGVLAVDREWHVAVVVDAITIQVGGTGAPHTDPVHPHPLMIDDGRGCLTAQVAPQPETDT